MSQANVPIAYAVPPAANPDLKHLDLLAIFHWIAGGLTIAMSLFGVIYIIVGSLMLAGTIPMNTNDPNFPGDFFAWMMLVMGIAVVLLGTTMGLLNIYSGFCLKKHKKRTFCIVIAAIDCLSFPIGTTLGVFTIVVLLRDSVKALYEAEAARHGSA